VTLQWLRHHTRARTGPRLVDGDVDITQSNAMIRHLARKHGLYGSGEVVRGWRGSLGVACVRCSSGGGFRREGPGRGHVGRSRVCCLAPISLSPRSHHHHHHHTLHTPTGDGCC
jgi:hypothetical protein